jgi:hypothetical protein
VDRVIASGSRRSSEKSGQANQLGLKTDWGISKRMEIISKQMEEILTSSISICLARVLENLEHLDKSQPDLR